MSNIERNKQDGYFLISRSVFDSWIWDKPDWHFKLWIYFIGKANHSDKGEFLRGELFLKRGYIELQEALTKHGGYGKKKFEKYEISKAISAMASEGLICTRKATRGMFIKVLNYDDYQTSANYEKQQEKQQQSNSNATAEQQSSSTVNKNDKNVKNKKNVITKGEETPAPVTKTLAVINYQDLAIQLEVTEDVVKDYEARITDYCLSTGKRYKDIPATIRNWYRKDHGSAKKPASHHKTFYRTEIEEKAQVEQAMLDGYRQRKEEKRLRAEGKIL